MSDSAGPAAKVLRFRYDRYGGDREVAQTEPTPERLKEFANLARLMRSFDETLRYCGFEMTDMVRYRRLPASVVPTELRAAADRQQRGDYGKIATDLTLLRDFAAVLQNRSPFLAPQIGLAIRVREDLVRLGVTPSEETLERAIERYLGIALLERGPQRDLGTIEGLAAWRQELERLREEHAAGDPFDVAQEAKIAWNRWWQTMLGWLEYRETPQDSLGYGDAVLAALDRLPSTLLSPNLNQVTIADWSAFCRRVFGAATPGADEPAPGWAFVIGLAALGFGNATLSHAVKWAGARLEAPEPSRLMVLVEKAPPDQPGICFLYRNAGAMETRWGSSDLPPVFAVPWDHIKDYEAILTWLATNDAISARIEQYGENDLKQLRPAR